MPLLVTGAASVGWLGCGDSDAPGSGGEGGANTTTNTNGTTATNGTTTSAASTTTSTTSAASTTTSTTASASSTSASRSTGMLPTCDDYPVEASFPDTSAAALTELQSFAPAATLTWAPQRGTLGSVNGLNIPIDCTADVWSGAWDILNAHPTLFQLDESEWQAPPVFPCSAISSIQIASTYRMELSGVGVQKDVFSLVLGPLQGGGVELRGVSGFYLPVLAPGELDACPNIDDALMESVIRQRGPYPYATFFQCTPTGSGMYTPQPNDVVVFGDETWEWDDGTGTVVANKRRIAKLIIDESNYTPELMASDLNCPDASGENRVLGYTISFDPVTGDFLGVMPGIDCIVCLQ